MSQLNLLGKIGKVFLIVLNVSFLILGVALFVGGIVLYANSGPAQHNVAPLMDNIKVGSTFSLGNLVKIISGIVIFVGFFSFFVSVLGIVGASKQKKYVLISYACILSVVCILEMVVIGGFFQLKGDLNTTIKRKMLELLVPYEGNAGNALTMAWNWLFLSLDCCGVNAINQSNDFAYTTWWQSLTRGSDQIPGYCCADATADTAAQNSRQACAVSPTPLNAFVDRGCFDALKDVMTSYGTTFMVICILCLLVEIAAIVFASMMAYQLMKGGKDKMSTKKNLA